MDFNGDSRGLVYLHIESPAISPIDEEMAMTNYVYDGNNGGTFDYNTYHMTFTIDGLNRTMEVDSLRLGLELDDTGNKTYFGGYGVSVHLFPFRTEKLSLTSPMILHLFVEK